MVAGCDGYEFDIVSLSAGQHTVRMVARLPGTDVTFETPEELVELSCDADVLDAVDDEGEAGVTNETGEAYGATPARNPVVIGQSTEGCSLSAAPARSSGSALGVSSLLAALVLGWSRRSRGANRAG